MDGLKDDWFLKQVARSAEEHLSKMSWRELGPAGRILRHGADYKVQEAHISDVREVDGTLHIGLSVRLSPHVPENVVILVEQVKPPR